MVHNNCFLAPLEMPLLMTCFLLFFMLSIFVAKLQQFFRTNLMEGLLTITRPLFRGHDPPYLVYNAVHPRHELKIFFCEIMHVDVFSFFFFYFFVLKYQHVNETHCIRHECQLHSSFKNSCNRNNIIYCLIDI